VHRASVTEGYDRYSAAGRHRLPVAERVPQPGGADLPQRRARGGGLP
jgi:hypothetical protein